MKKTGYILLLLSLLLSCGANNLFGQKKVDISAGIGVPEFINICARYQISQTQIGFGIGYFPDKDNSIFSLSGDLFFHFGGVSELSNRHPWHIRSGISFLKIESETVYDNFWLLNLRIGREINFSKKIGVGIDAGPGILLFHKHEQKQPDSGTWDMAPPVWPSAGISVFYHI